MKKETAVIFIHGTPGSADAFFDYLKDTILRDKFSLITFDRLGYGYSNYGKPELNIAMQARAIKSLAATYKNTIFVGHSYGGPIAVEALLQNNNANACLLIAPTLFPHKEKFYGVSKITSSKVGKLLVSDAIYVASEEKINHENALKMVVTNWKNIKKKIVYIHSKDDDIVPYQINYEYLKILFPNAQLDTITLEEGNHFLPWNNHELIREKLLELGNTE